MKAIANLLQLFGFILLFIVFPLGAILGIALMIYGSVLYNQQRRLIHCPSCRGKIDYQAQKCMHCAEDLAARWNKLCELYRSGQIKFVESEVKAICSDNGWAKKVSLKWIKKKSASI